LENIESCGTFKKADILNNNNNPYKPNKNTYNMVQVSKEAYEDMLGCLEQTPGFRHIPLAWIRPLGQDDFLLEFFPGPYRLRVLGKEMDPETLKKYLLRSVEVIVRESDSSGKVYSRKALDRLEISLLHRTRSDDDYHASQKILEQFAGPKQEQPAGPEQEQYAESRQEQFEQQQPS